MEKKWYLRSYPIIYYWPNENQYKMTFYGYKEGDNIDDKDLPRQEFWFDSIVSMLTFLEEKTQNGVSRFLKHLDELDGRIFSIEQEGNTYILDYAGVNFDEEPKLHLVFDNIKEIFELDDLKEEHPLVKPVIPQNIKIAEIDHHNNPNKEDNKYHALIYYSVPQKFDNLVDCFKFLLKFKNGEEIIQTHLPRL